MAEGSSSDHKLHHEKDMSSSSLSSCIVPSSASLLRPPTIILPDGGENEDMEEDLILQHMDFEDSDLPERFKHFTLRKQTSYR